MVDDYNISAEQAVLGSLLLDQTQEIVSNAVEKLQTDDFSGVHQTIFESILSLRELEKPVDIITLNHHLNERGVIGEIGGISYLSRLAESVPTTSNADHYITILAYLGLKRRMKVELDDQRRLLDEESDPKVILSNIQSATDKLSGQIRSEKTLTRLGDILKDHEDQLEARAEAKGITGVPTCGSDLNKLTGGRQKQDLIIVAARPSVGKTAFMLNNSKAAAKAGYAVAIFSLEMPAEKLAERLIANEGHIDSNIIRTGLLSPEDWEKYTKARTLINELPIFIDDTPGISIQEIASKVKKIKKLYSNLFVQIDYLQLISSGKRLQSREQEIAFISRSLKQIARDNDCPVEALSQLSRSVEQRQDKRPMISDLRESGSIEQDADEIDFLYRDDYYNAETEKKNIVEIIVAKGRNTGTGLVDMVYLKNYSKFVNYERIV